MSHGQLCTCWTGYWKFQGGVIVVQISKGCRGEKSDIFPEGPRALPEGNLPISHLQFDKSRNR